VQLLQTVITQLLDGSLEGRKAFLKQLLFSSPASLVLGLSQRISDEIRSLH
jgi:hypothetical protein